MKVAVIDLGTNTFHLLIVEATADSFKEVYRDRRFIHLASDGISTIGEAAYERAMTAMNDFGLQIIRHGVRKVAAKGTAALRRASNGGQFIKEVKSKTGIKIETISGDEEAKLIYLGTRQAVSMTDEKSLIIDVGGGSVEFIIANQREIFWAQSFPIGVAVLHRSFHHTEPITPTEIGELNGFLEKTLEPLKAAIAKYPVEALIGASGTFDVLENIMTIISEDKHSAEISVTDFQPLYDRLTTATLEERFEMKDIPNYRAELIVVAIALVNFILKKFHLQRVFVSNFAMKEGMIQELLNEK